MKIAFKKFLPGITWFFIVLVLVFLPAEDIPSVESSFLDYIYFDKWIHFGLFAVLVLFFCWPFYNSSFNRIERLHYFMKIAIVASLLGLVIEFIQKYFTAGRAFEILDWVADSLGALFAFWFCRKKFLKNA
ncbi:MAG TPA: VanZ family protein [Chitinophagaceae bacterium]|nr:VanZ family protein [Chitinophagaceae bacterium]